MNPVAAISRMLASTQQRVSSTTLLPRVKVLSKLDHFIVVADGTHFGDSVAVFQAKELAKSRHSISTPTNR
jgi:hypothetical protein